jgi:hypothetical protein
MSSPPDEPFRRRYFAPRDSFVNGRPNHNHRIPGNRTRHRFSDREGVPPITFAGDGQWGPAVSRLAKGYLVESGPQSITIVDTGLSHQAVESAASLLEQDEKVRFVWLCNPGFTPPSSGNRALRQGGDLGSENPVFGPDAPLPHVCFSGSWGEPATLLWLAAGCSTRLRCRPSRLT